MGRRREDKEELIKRELAVLEGMPDDQAVMPYSANGASQASAVVRTPDTRKHVFSIAKLPPDDFCNARRLDEYGEEGYCRSPAGMGTSTPGKGRCSKHGGASRGRYGGNTAVYDMVRTFENDRDPLDCTEDIHLLRGLIVKWIEGYDRWHDMLEAWYASFAEGSDAAPRPGKIMDLVEAHKMLSTLSQMADREKRKQSITAITREELIRFMSEMGRVVETYCTEEQIAEIRRGWLGLKIRTGIPKAERV